MKITRRGFHRLAAQCSVSVLLQGRSDFLLAETAGPPLQPFAAHVRRVIVALQSVGSPLPTPDLEALEDALRSNDTEGVAAIERALALHVLFEARINPEGRVSISGGKAKAELVEQGWRAFLVKVNNEAGITSAFKVRSEQAQPMGRPSSLAITRCSSAISRAPRGSCSAPARSGTWKHWTCTVVFCATRLSITAPMKSITRATRSSSPSLVLTMPLLQR